MFIFKVYPDNQDNLSFLLKILNLIWKVLFALEITFPGSKDSDVGIFGGPFLATTISVKVLVDKGVLHFPREVKGQSVLDCV